MNQLVDSAVATAKASQGPLLLNVNVDFDKSVVVQMVLFVTLMVVLKPLLLDPMLRLFALREERTDGAKASAREMQEKAAAILARYETEIAAAKAKANAEREKLRKETAAMEAEVLRKAQASADVITNEGRAKIATEVEALRSALKTSEGALARQISSKIVGREVRS